MGNVSTLISENKSYSSYVDIYIYIYVYYLRMRVQGLVEGCPHHHLAEAGTVSRGGAVRTLMSHEVIITWLRMRRCVAPPAYLSSAAGLVT